MNIIGTGKLVVTIQKCDNGYIANLIEAPKPPKRKASAKNIDAEVDNLIDGIVALNKHMESPPIDSERWRGGTDTDRTVIREAFKKTNPGLMEHLEPPPEPRIEQKVFPSKEDLFAYLTKNL